MIAVFAEWIDVINHEVLAIDLFDITRLICPLILSRKDTDLGPTVFPDDSNEPSYLGRESSACYNH